MSLTQDIKNEAKRLGFPLVGITTPERPSHWANFESWLKAGRHGEMTYLATERARLCRADPCRLLPDCSTILVLGIPYQPKVKPTQTVGRRASSTYLGKIASYAWGKDYHEVLPRRMQTLVSFIESLLGHAIASRWYTDTGPLLERDLAQRAGLGWIGKNTCLIHPHLGSYIFLAEILLDIQLEPDPPFIPDRCGTCTRCMNACPTGCILPDRTLDARRCIAYLTIELKGAVPVELRHAIDESVFGCDICQEVCPWNKASAHIPNSTKILDEFSGTPGVRKHELVSELRLTSGEFYQKFKDSPVKRAKRLGYLRNVVLALGNQASRRKDDSVIPLLAQVLIHDPEPLVRLSAAWSLGLFDREPTRQILAAALAAEHDPDVLSEIHRSLNP
jgi:epoxyqueuosine reductase